MKPGQQFNIYSVNQVDIATLFSIFSTSYWNFNSDL